MPVNFNFFLDFARYVFTLIQLNGFQFNISSSYVNYATPTGRQSGYVIENYQLGDNCLLFCFFFVVLGPIYMVSPPEATLSSVYM